MTRRASLVLGGGIQASNQPLDLLTIGNSTDRRASLVLEVGL